MGNLKSPYVQDWHDPVPAHELGGWPQCVHHPPHGTNAPSVKSFPQFLPNCCRHAWRGHYDPDQTDASDVAWQLVTVATTSVDTCGEKTSMDGNPLLRVEAGLAF
jgi:hypothetical protein